MQSPSKKTVRGILSRGTVDLLFSSGDLVSFLVLLSSSSDVEVVAKALEYLRVVTFNKKIAKLKEEQIQDE